MANTHIDLTNGDALSRFNDRAPTSVRFLRGEAFDNAALQLQRPTITRTSIKREAVVTSGVADYTEAEEVRHSFNPLNFLRYRKTTAARY